MKTDGKDERWKGRKMESTKDGKDERWRERQMENGRKMERKTNGE